MPAMEPVKICMVGSGRMAAYHSDALRKIPGVHLETVVDPDLPYAEVLSNEFGYPRVRATLDEALAMDEFDAVVVATPNPLHAEQSAAALENEKHVLCEVPLALSYAEAQALARLSLEKQRHLMVCHTLRFYAGRLELQRRIDTGVMRPLRVMGRYAMLRRGQLKSDRARKGWDDNVLWHHGCHAIDAVMEVVGPHEPIDLQVQFGPVWPALGVPLDVDLQWRAMSSLTGEEVTVVVNLSHNDPWSSSEIRVVGVEETLVLDGGSLHSREGIIVDGGSLGTAVDTQDAEFVAAIREGRPPRSDVHSALPTLKLVQAAWDEWLKDRL